MTETFEQMALRLAENLAGPCAEDDAKREIIDFATRLRAEWMKQFAVGFEEWAHESRNVVEENYYECGSKVRYHYDDKQREAYLAGAASQQAETMAQARLVGMGAERELALLARIAELETELKSLPPLSEFE